MNGKKCTIVAEVAQTHDGSLGQAHAFIDAIANAGADAVKFQTHIANAESSPDEPWRIKFSKQDVTRFDYWKRMEFTEKQWGGLKQHADERGLSFLSSPFSLEAVDLLSRVGVSAWKIASGEINNIPMLERMAETGLPFIISSGMSPISELDATVKWIKGKKIPLTILQCTTSYPCPPENIGLNVIQTFHDRYGDCAVGFSDHSGTIYAGLAAATLGVDMIEVHITLSREMFGPDVSASITSAELSQLVEGVRFIEKTLANPVDKDKMADEMQPLRNLFMKSIFVRETLSAGTILCREHLIVKKPGTGIPATQLDEIIGRRLRIDIQGNQMLADNALEAEK